MTKQPKLKNEWGTQFFGVAKSDGGDLWYYEEHLSNGEIKKHPLMLMHPTTRRPHTPHEITRASSRRSTYLFGIALRDAVRRGDETLAGILGISR